jgi:hypothetical protein
MARSNLRDALNDLARGTEGKTGVTHGDSSERLAAAVDRRCDWILGVRIRCGAVTFTPELRDAWASARDAVQRGRVNLGPGI